MMSTRRNTEKGSILIIGSLTIMGLMAFMGLAFDVSYLFFKRRTMQTAADAGALAISQMMYQGSTLLETAQDAARKDAAFNGYTHGVNGVSVAVNIPPTLGPRAGTNGFAEVIVTQTQPTWFMRAVNWNSATIRARAVAGLISGNGCVYALNSDISNQNNGFKTNGTTDSRFDCGVYSNSNFRAVGTGCVVTSMASFTGVYDNHNTSNNCGPASHVQGAQVTDPFAALSSRLGLGQMPPSYDCANSTIQGIPETSSTPFLVRGRQISNDNEDGVNDGIVTLKAGVYCGGIRVTGNVVTVKFTADSFGRNYFILAGGGMSLNAGVNVDARGYYATNGQYLGVTFFNTFVAGSNQFGTYDGIRINGSTVAMAAPASGPYKALLVWQDPRVAYANNNGTSITATSSSTIQGILYFPTTDLTYAGSSSTTMNGSDGYTILIAYNVNINGKATVNSDFSAIGGLNPVQVATFVE